MIGRDKSKTDEYIREQEAKRTKLLEDSNLHLAGLVESNRALVEAEQLKSAIHAVEQLMKAERDPEKLAILETKYNSLLRRSAGLE